MSKRVAVVSGGIGGLGTEICKTLADAGRTVDAADLASRPDRVEAFTAADTVILRQLNSHAHQFAPAARRGAASRSR